MKKPTDEVYWNLTRHTLWVMRTLYDRGRTSVSIREIAFYLHENGIHSTSWHGPDFKLVEHILGPKGLGLDRRSQGHYPIPLSSLDFIRDAKRGIYPPDFTEANIDRQCEKYKVPSRPSIPQEAP